jgi:phosphinothricin acetyltransferase
LNDKIIIRSAEQRDAEAILDIYTPYITDTPVSFETEVPTIHAFEQRIVDYQEKMPWLVCEIHNKIAGYTYATNHRQRTAYDCSKELSVYIHKDYRNRGIATGLYTSILEILKHQGVTNVLAGIALPNDESVGFHESFGFKLVGIYHKVGFKLGRFHDAGWWELAIGDNATSRVEIKPAHELKNTGIWSRAIAMGISKIS